MVFVLWVQWYHLDSASVPMCVCFEKLCTAMHCSVCTVRAWLHWSERECGGNHRCPHHTQDQPHCKHRDNVCECVSPCVWVEWAKGYPLANLNPNASYLFCLPPWYLEPQSVPFSCQTHLLYGFPLIRDSSGSISSDTASLTVVFLYTVRAMLVYW